jgi:hypothetical protein
MQSSASRWNIACYTNASTQHINFCMESRKSHQKVLIDNLSKETSTFSTTMMYRASVFKTNFSSKLRSPEIGCPDDPHAEQSTTSWFGSYACYKEMELENQLNIVRVFSSQSKRKQCLIMSYLCINNQKHLLI